MSKTKTIDLGKHIADDEHDWSEQSATLGHAGSLFEYSVCRVCRMLRIDEDLWMPILQVHSTLHYQSLKHEFDVAGSRMWYHREGHSMIWMRVLDVLGYWHRPWHYLFGHGDCAMFLRAERAFPTDREHPIYNHDCCECGLAIKPVLTGCPKCGSFWIEPTDFDATHGQCNDCGHEWPNEEARR